MDSSIDLGGSHPARAPRVTAGLVCCLIAIGCGTPQEAPGSPAMAPEERRPETVRVPALRNPHGPLVVLGASYAKGLTLDGLTRDVPVLVRSRDGQQTWELAGRFDADVLAVNPRAVIIWGFINDLFRSPRDRVAEATSRARDSVQHLVARARAAGIEPILTTELTIAPRVSWRERLAGLIGPLLGRSSYQSYINGHVAEMNDWMRAYARAEAVLLLDLGPVLSDSSGIRRPEFAADDGSHVSDAGYAALNSYAVPILRAHFARVRPQ